MKSGVPGWGDPPQSGPPKFRTFKPLELDGLKNSEWVDIKNKLNLTKIGVQQWGFLLQTGPLKFKLYNLLS